MKIAVIGGGSTYTPELVDGLLTIGRSLGCTELALVDIPESAEKLATVAAFARRMVTRAGSRLLITENGDLARGVRGATVVINQFRVGGLAARAQDEIIPLDFGLIGQETTGVGGMMKALRTLPVLDTIVAAVQKHAPGAWLINFTNPAGINTEYIVNSLGYERAIGLCNVPIEFLLRAAEILECDRNDVFLKYYGLNHLSWVERVYLGGEDRTADFWHSFTIQMKNNPDAGYGPEFLAMLQLLPNPYLEYYYNTRDMVRREIEDRDGPGTRAEQIQKLEPKLLKLYREADRDVVPEELSERGGFMYSTVAVELIVDLLTDAGRTHIVNVRNGSAVPNIPADYVLEIPARVGANGAEPLEIGPAHPATLGLIHSVKSFERLTIAAHRSGDERYAKQAMVAHPLGPMERDLETLWDRLKAANRQYLGFDGA